MLESFLRPADVLNQSEHFAYDTLGNLIGTQDKKGQVTVNTYNNMNRLTRTQTGPMATNYTYDNFGNTTNVSNGTDSTSYSYTYNNLLATMRKACVKGTVLLTHEH